MRQKRPNQTIMKIVALKMKPRTISSSQNRALSSVRKKNVRRLRVKTAAIAEFFLLVDGNAFKLMFGELKLLAIIWHFGAKVGAK